MRRQTSDHRLVMQIVDFALLFLLLAVALFSSSIALIGVSIAGLMMSLREFLLLTVSRGRSKNGSRYYQYGIGKIVQAGSLVIALSAVLAGFWLAGQAFGLMLSGFSEVSPLGLALAATANALVMIWNGFVAYAHNEPFDRAKQLLLQTRRRRFASLLAFQILLTIAVLAKDPVIAFWIDILGATVISLLMTVGGIKVAWEGISDLVDYPLDREREGAIIALLYREGVKPEELIDLRTRRCAQRIFAELTLRTVETIPIEEVRQRLVHLRRALETELTDLDIVVKLHGSEPLKG